MNVPRGMASSRPDPDAGSREDREVAGSEEVVAPDRAAVANDGGSGPPFIPSWMRRKFVHNEQVKLTASALNTISVAFFVTGILTPLVTYVQAPRTITTPEAFLVGVGWLLTATILHQIARLVLTGLEP